MIPASEVANGAVIGDSSPPGVKLVLSIVSAFFVAASSSSLDILPSGVSERDSMYLLESSERDAPVGTFLETSTSVS